MIYNLLFSFYEKTTDFIKGKINDYFSATSEKGLVEKNIFLLGEHLFFLLFGLQVQIEKIIRENRFQGGRKSTLSGCNSHFHMYAKTQLGRCAAHKSAF